MPLTNRQTARDMQMVRAKGASLTARHSNAERPTVRKEIVAVFGTNASRLSIQDLSDRTPDRTVGGAGKGRISTQDARCGRHVAAAQIVRTSGVCGVVPDLQT